MKNFVKVVICLWMLVGISGEVDASTWSFAGGHIYFDNSQTKWQDEHIYLVIGKSTYTSVYPMQASAEANLYVCALPHQGWGDAEYMAVIGHHDWNSGEYGPDQLVNATHYTGLYSAGLSSKAEQGFLFTPASADNGAVLKLDWRGDNYGVNFSDTEKNNCQKVNAADSTVTIIFSTSSKRFNKEISQISKVYTYGSISKWNDQDEDYRLFDLSTDGCLYRTFRFSEVARPGNSGQPEFLFHVFLTDGSSYKCRSHSSWTGGIDSRLVFINNGENMMIAWPEDDLEELAARKAEAQYVKPLSEFDLTDSAELAHLTNFRRVPATTHLYRSYHPYKPDRAEYDTEHERMTRLAELGAKYGIKSDIALSGNESAHAGEKYTCGGQEYSITIPPYYQAIMDSDNVCYVGTANGHIPDYSHAVFETDGERFGEWMQEVVRFINDHPAPFQIHCSLGADRTGAFSATLAALCGATWEQIAADYSETSNLKIQEYRHSNSVRYELYLLTGRQPEYCANLSQEVADHFIQGGYLTQAEIDACVMKLTDNDAPTGMQQQKQSESVRPAKMWQDGQLLIRRGNSVYDACGRMRD